MNLGIFEIGNFQKFYDQSERKVNEAKWAVNLFLKFPPRQIFTFISKGIGLKVERSQSKFSKILQVPYLLEDKKFQMNLAWFYGKYVFIFNKFLPSFRKLKQQFSSGPTQNYILEHLSDESLNILYFENP